MNLINVTQELERLEKLMSDFSLHHSQQTPSLSRSSVKVCEFVSAQFSEDKQWYRAQVISIEDDTSVTVLYIDYGNTEALGMTDIRPLTSPFLVRDLSAQSVNVELAFIDLPSPSEDFSLDALDLLQSLLTRGNLTMRVISKSSHLSQVLLYANDVLINQELIANGYATVRKSIVKQLRQSGSTDGSSDENSVFMLVKSLIHAQEQALKQRVSHTL